MDKHLRARIGAPSDAVQARQAGTGGMAAAVCAMLTTGLLPVVLALLPHAVQAQAPGDARRAQIVNMVRQDCGSCHGMTLRGGLGPSLEARSLAGKDAAQLQYVILNGRRGTPMPPWKDFLSETEAAWVVDLLQAGTLDGVQHAR